MLILDTDHLSAMAHERGASVALLRRLSDAGQDIATTVVSVEEQVRGWLAQIGRAKTDEACIRAYAKFQRSVEDLGCGIILPFDAVAASQFQQLKAIRLGVSTMDLRIAAIAMTNGATLLSRNLRDFERVAGLKVENWLDA
jgi:tRNA(fMet)-specific endonuclease VapC